MGSRRPYRRGVRSGDATWNRFRKNLQLAASVGLNSYRFSIEWSRLEPEEGLWNTVALNRYGEILLEGEWLGPCRIMFGGRGRRQGLHAGPDSDKPIKE